ncbi:MAG: hypothetical protein LBR93_01340 [Treponema sp.]|nr:hypothetical protein [Treponema sp.]
MRKLLVSGLVILLALSTSCKKSEGNAGTGSGQVQPVSKAGSGKTLLKVGIDSTLDTLNPWAVAKPSKSFICNVLYQPLALSLSVNSADMKGVLARSWEQVDDVTWRIHL